MDDDGAGIANRDLVYFAAGYLVGAVVAGCIVTMLNRRGCDCDDTADGMAHTNGSMGSFTELRLGEDVSPFAPPERADEPEPA